MFKLSNELDGFSQIDGGLVNMVKWEGATFIILVLILSLAHSYMYLSDKRKTKSITLFFASLTHELKTPLASIKLQAQVLNDLLSEIEIDSDAKIKVEKYILRLMQSSKRLEDEVDKHFELARVEQNGQLNCTEVELCSLIKRQIKNFPEIDISVGCDLTESYVLANEFAIDTILRNLLENISRHAKSDHRKASFQVSKVDNETILTVKDNGAPFEGDISKLGQLFYKHSSPKGSGLGLYICKKLMQQMKSKISFSSSPALLVKLHFKGTQNG